MQMFIYSSDFM